MPEPTTLPNYVIAIMAVIVLILLAYTISLCLRLWRQNRSIAQQAEDRKQSLQAKRLDAQASIDILLRCVLQDQVSLTEGAIRISGLAKVLGSAVVEQTFYQPFDALAMATSHIPILDDWAKLSSKEKRRLDEERAVIEGEHRDKVMHAAKQLLKPQ
jgi:hypothetical protein